MLDTELRAGRGWQRPTAEMDSFGEIGGRTVGLVGYGAVPQLLAPVLRAMGASVLFWTREPKPRRPRRGDPCPSLLETADILSLHLPLTPETERLIDGPALARMRPGAVLINTARGGLVDEPALIEALRAGRLAAAGLDVFAAEPLPAGHPLTKLPNVVLMPHLAWLTPETLLRSWTWRSRTCRRLGTGEALLHRVA